jgi:toxin ParE1/3/4
MAEVIWAKRAVNQLERAVRYVAEERGNTYAKIVLERILNAAELLGQQPQLGFIEPLLVHRKYEYRSIVVWSYKIIYRCSSKHIIISRVFHTSRNPDKLKGV